MGSAFELDRLTKRYGTLAALDDVTLSVSSADAWLAFDDTPPRQVPPLSVTGSPSGSQLTTHSSS